MIDGIWFAKSTIKLATEHGYKLTELLSDIPQYKNSEFPEIDATRITGTHLVAAAGPSTSNEVVALFSNTVFNKTKPIKEFVLLVDCLGLGDNVKYTDCVGYCLQPDDDEQEVKQEEQQFGPYRLQIKNISGSYQLCLNGCQFGIDDPIIKTEMKVYNDSSESKEPITAHATILKLRDNSSIVLNLESEYKENKSAREKGENLKATLWAIYQQSLNEETLIHCARGVGRTGHLIFTLELLKLFTDPSFFVEYKTSEDIKDKILGTLIRIRENRPALVFTDTQFTQAIRNAYVLRQYALEHKLMIDKSVSEERKHTATI